MGWDTDCLSHRMVQMGFFLGLESNYFMSEGNIDALWSSNIGSPLEFEQNEITYDLLQWLKYERYYAILELGVSYGTSGKGRGRKSSIQKA